jgi:hypothetical protein
MGGKMRGRPVNQFIVLVVASRVTPVPEDGRRQQPEK